MKDNKIELFIWGIIIGFILCSIWTNWGDKPAYHFGLGMAMIGTTIFGLIFYAGWSMRELLTKEQ